MTIIQAFRAFKIQVRSKFDKAEFLGAATLTGYPHGREGSMPGREGGIRAREGRCLNSKMLQTTRVLCIKHVFH